MRNLALALSAPLLFGAAPPAAIVSLPAYEQPARKWASVDEAEAQACRGRIDRVRAEAGQPRIERAPADAARPILQYAVDRRIDGCGVLVLVGAPGDILPPPEPGPAVVIPALPPK